MATFKINDDRNWYVVRTNVKCERKAEDNIRAAGFDVYCPRRRVEKKMRRTNVVVVTDEPLMMRYLFVGLRSHNLVFGFVRACEGVECLLGVQGKPLRVPAPLIESILDSEINMEFDDTREARIHRKEEARTRKETLEKQFPAGKLVQITEGPFASFNAVVNSITSKGDIEVLISLFGRLSPIHMRSTQLVA